MPRPNAHPMCAQERLDKLMERSQALLQYMQTANAWLAQVPQSFVLVDMRRAISEFRESVIDTLLKCEERVTQALLGQDELLDGNDWLRITVYAINREWMRLKHQVEPWMPRAVPKCRGLGASRHD